MNKLTIPNDLIILIQISNNINENLKEMADSIMLKSSDFRIIREQEILNAELRDETTIQKIVIRQQDKKIPSVLFIKEGMKLTDKEFINKNNTSKLFLNKTGVYPVYIEKDSEFYKTKNFKCGEETKGRSFSGIINFIIDEIAEFCEQQKFKDEEKLI